MDEWTDEQQQQQQSMIDNNTEWSIEKILYPDWLYKDRTMTTPKKRLNTSTFTDFNSCQTFETNGSTISHSSNGKRTPSMNSQPSPKQVRFGCQEQIYSYPHLTTTIQQLRTRITATISNDETDDTFI